MAVQLLVVWAGRRQSLHADLSYTVPYPTPIDPTPPTPPVAPQPPNKDSDLLHIAEQAMTAPLPPGWTVHLDADGAEFFYDTTTQVGRGTQLLFVDTDRQASDRTSRIGECTLAQENDACSHGGSGAGVGLDTELCSSDCVSKTSECTWMLTGQSFFFNTANPVGRGARLHLPDTFFFIST